MRVEPPLQREGTDRAVFMAFPVLIAFILFFALTIHKGVQAQDERIACAEYDTQSNAQRIYDTNPVKYKQLDRDHDQVACESLK